MKVDDDVRIVYQAMIKAVFERSDPDDLESAEQSAMDALRGMTYGTIQQWSFNITLDDDPLVIVFNPDNYSFILDSTEDV